MATRQTRLIRGFAWAALATVASCMTGTWLMWLTIEFVLATCFAMCPVILLVALVTHSACLFGLAVVYFVRTVFSSVAVAAAVYPLLATVAPSVVTRSWTTVTFVALKHIPWCLVLGCRSEGDTWLLCPVVNRNVVRTGIWL